MMFPAVSKPIFRIKVPFNWKVRDAKKTVKIARVAAEEMLMNQEAATIQRIVNDRNTNRSDPPNLL
jgi:hypothetical protein